MVKALPEWLASLLPESRPPALIVYADEKYTAYYAQDESQDFDNLEEAYDTSISKNMCVIFDETSIPNKRVDESFLVPGNAQGGSRLLESTPDGDELGILNRAYQNWTKWRGEKYEAGERDFLNSYNFLDGHPCFWTRRDDQKFVEDYPYAWDTNGHAMRLWSKPVMSNKIQGKLVFMMESGAHVAPNYTHTYHDLRLDVWGTSYEDAIIKTAELVHKFFNLDGTARENVEYEKSEIELALESSVEAFKASQKEISEVSKVS